MGARKKILQICAVDFTLKNLLLPLINKFSEEGFDVYSVCTDGPEIQELRLKGYQVETIKISRRISPINNLISLIKLLQYMNNNKFDIVHVHTPVASVLGRIAAKLAGVPLIVYTAHGFYFHDRMSKWKKDIIIAVERFMGKYFTDIIFTQSNEDRNTAINEKIIASDRIYCIGNGINLDKFNIDNISINLIEKRKELNIHPNTKVVGFVGRIVKEKGIIDLVLSFMKVLNKVPDTNLLIIGDHLSSDRDLTTKNKILSLIKEYNLKDKIIFTGYRSDINELLAIMDIFVLPSYREGMPRALIEAMAMGKPVVATNIRGCREEMLDGRTGFLIPVADPDKLAEAILKLLQDEQLAIKMGHEGCTRAYIEFNEEKVLKKQIDIISIFERK